MLSQSEGQCNVWQVVPNQDNRVSIIVFIDVEQTR